MTTPQPTFESQLNDARAYLLRFARLQLRNDAWAEDAVSETVLAALCAITTALRIGWGWQRLRDGA